MAFAAAVRQRKDRVYAKPPLEWTPVQTKFLALMFEGRLSLIQISKKLSVPKSTLRLWSDNPDFQAYLTGMRDNLDTALEQLRVPYTRIEHRVIALSRMAEHARDVFEEHPTLLDRRFIGFDRKTGKPLIVENEVFNESAHKAFRDSLADIAKELGHRQSKLEVTGKDGQKLFDTDAIAAETDERFAAFVARAAKTRVLAVVDSDAESGTAVPMDVLGEGHATRSEGD